ncbi:E3 ubiquitin-protein ligase TRIM21-like [Xenentodon cancila]
MPAAGCLLTEDQLRCSICLDVFTDPISTPCGHNFCKNCITEQLNIDAPLQCPVCLKMFYPKPDLQVNTLIAEMVHVFRRPAGGSSSKQQAANPGVSHYNLCAGIKRTALFFFLMFACVLIIFSQIQNDPPLKEEPEGKKLKRPDEDIQDVKRGTGLSIDEVQQLNTGDASFAQTLRSLKKSVDQSLNKLTDMQRTTEQFVCELQKRRTEEELFPAAQMEQMFSAVMKKELPKLLLRTELLRLQRYAVDVTLDPDTAYSELILSDDGKQVRCCDSKRSVPDNPKRFAHHVVVLGKQRFSSGRFYFEVQVRGKTEWSLGVARESIDRRGRTTLRPQFGYWAVRLTNGDEYRALAGPSVRLSVRSAPETVGVFVDYEEGLVSFYDADAATLMHSFAGCSFTVSLHPLFDPSLNNDGNNSAPLIITPVNHTE